jgi:hypothetical protein
MHRPSTASAASADLDRKAHLAAARLGRVRILGDHERGANQFAHIVDRRAANVLKGQVVDQQARAVALENAGGGGRNKGTLAI